MDDLGWLILLDKDLKSSGPSSSVKLLTCDFVPSTINDVDYIKWITNVVIVF